VSSFQSLFPDLFI